MKKTIQTPSYKDLYQSFETYVRVKGYKQGKGKMYEHTLREFLIWLEDNGITKIAEVTGKETVKYFDYLSTRPNQKKDGVLSDKSLKFHGFVMGLFVKDLLENRILANGFYIPSVGGYDSQARNILSVEEIKTVFEHCSNEMEKALLSVGYGCGLRRSEIRALDVKDVQLTSGMLIVRSGKGDKRREVPMSDSVVIQLRKYITEERHQKLTGKNQLEEALFINSLGKRMSGQILNDLLGKMMEQTGNFELIQKEITLHCLRHSIAQHLSDNGANIEFIRRFLGHTEINTTYLYAIKNKKRKPTTTF